MKITAVIPVRKGSQRVKDKNLRPFAGTTLLDIKIKSLFHESLKFKAAPSWKVWTGNDNSCFFIECAMNTNTHSSDFFTIRMLGSCFINKIT